MANYYPNQPLNTQTDRPNLLLSACIQGEEVRYNGGHKRNSWAAGVLTHHCQLLPICPEVDMGMGVPRPTIQVVVPEPQGAPQIIAKDGSNHSAQALRQQQAYREQLPWQMLDGMILQAKSPSCGLERVNQYNQAGELISHHGQGLFAAFFEQQAPALPKIDSGRLQNPELRQQFMVAVFAHQRFRTLAKTPSALQAFHRRYKYLLMESDYQGLQEMGRLVAATTTSTVEENSKSYLTLLMEALQKIPSEGTRTNTFQHLMGYLKKEITAEDKQYLLNLLQNYRDNLCGFEIPRAVLRYLIHKHQIDYVMDQFYFEPFPEVLLTS